MRVKRLSVGSTFCSRFYYKQTHRSTHLELVTENIRATWIPWSNYSFKFLEQSVKISSLNSNTECSYSRCLFKTAYNASNSTDVDALQFQRVQYDTFYNGQIQQDSSKCVSI